MKKAKIPTIIGFIILVLGLATGVILVQGRQIFKLGATAQAAPKDVRISNISATSFSVTWLTDIQTSGFIKYGESGGSLSSTQTEEIQSPGYTHSAKLSALKPETTYFFKINSGGSDFDNNGTTWQQKTGPTVAEPDKANLISGSVLTAGSTPAQNAIVYVSLGGALLSTLTSSTGNFVIPISSARTEDLSQLQVIDEKTTLLQISVQAGPAGTSSAQIYPQSARPIQAIILGQTYDFKNLPANQSSEVPIATIGLPENTTPSSGFNVATNAASPSAKTVTLQSIKNDEVVTSTKPEFFGQGPAGTAIKITVESNPINGQATVSQTGSWSWDIPQNLDPGSHIITISWVDASGITRTLTRNFVVQASEGPAFVATPSATATGSATPTAYPTSTPLATISASPTSTATPFPQPATGSLTPTLLLSIMGIGLIAFSFLLYQYSRKF